MFGFTYIANSSFYGMKNIAKACNTKSAISCSTKKEPTHVSVIARKRMAISVFICIDLNVDNKYYVTWKGNSNFTDDTMRVESILC